MIQVFAQVFLLKRKNEENDQNEMISLERRCIFLISCRSTMEKEQFTIYFVFGFFYYYYDNSATITIGNTKK